VIAPSLAPFRIADFRLLWGSRLVASAGFWMDNVTTGWLALQVGGSPAAVGTVFALRLLPFLLLGLVAGTLADRVPRRTILMGVGGWAAAVAGTLALLASGGAIQFWQIALLAFATGCGQVFDMPSRTALAVDLVGRERLPQAVALTAVGFYLFGALGAFVAGVVIAAVGPAGSYAAIASCHLASVGFLARLRHRPPRRAVASPGDAAFVRTLVGAARLIAENPGVRMVVVASLAVELFGYSYQTAVPSVARDVLRVGSEGLGLLSAGASIGATAATVGLTFLPSQVRRQPLLCAVILAWGAAQVVLGGSALFALSFGAMLLAGACAAGVDALQQTLVQLAVPEEQRGRAMGVWVFSIGTNALGFYQVGLVAAAVGTPLGLIANGSLAALCAVAILAFAPTYRWRPRTLVAARAATTVGAARCPPGSTTRPR